MSKIDSVLSKAGLSRTDTIDTAINKMSGSYGKIITVGGSHHCRHRGCNHNHVCYPGCHNRRRNTRRRSQRNRKRFLGSRKNGILKWLGF